MPTALFNKLLIAALRGGTEIEMNKNFAVKITSLGLALLCGATFALSACGDKEESSNKETEDPSTEILTADPNVKVTEDTFPIETLPPEDENVREPVDNPRAEMMVKYYYDLAMQAYGWVYTECMPITGEDGVEIDGETYYPIVTVFETALLDNATIETYNDLTDYINAIFDKAIAEVIVADTVENYRDIDGVLHCRIFDPKTDDSADAEITTEAFLSKVGSESFRYTVKETVMKDGETTVYFHDYVYENTSNGWRWTAFPLV